MAPTIGHGSLGLVHLAEGDADRAMAFFGDVPVWLPFAGHGWWPSSQWLRRRVFMRSVKAGSCSGAILPRCRC
jgi:hypothetical protein